MDSILNFFEYLSSNWIELLEMLYQHMLMVGLGILLALIIGVPLGILCTKSKKIESTIISIANLIQVIPSLALLALLMIVFGIGFKTVVIGLFLYSLLPIIRNTAVGLKEVNQEYIDAGSGMGMTGLQLLFKVKFPLALPFALAGLRIAVVIAIGVATLAPFVGGEGLGSEIISGINLRNTNKIYGGAIIAALLAVVVDYLFGRLQKHFEVNK